MIEPTEPEHIQLFNYWNEKRKDRFAPTRSDLDPVDIPNLLPHLCLYKVHTDPYRYETVVMGTGVSDMWGIDSTGKFVDEIMLGPIYEKIKLHFETMITEKNPTVHDLDASWVNKDFIKYTRLMLPLSDDGKNVDRILVCIILQTRASLKSA